jgi:RNA binding exosome subunit
MISFIKIQTIFHATEDPNKVLKAIKFILPTDYVDDVEFKKRTLKGHYGNPIGLLETTLEKGDIIGAFMENLSSNLNKVDKITLFDGVEHHTENGSLYIRFDKQAALDGLLRLCASDPIRVQIRFRKKKAEDIIRICQEIGIFSKE